MKEKLIALFGLPAEATDEDILAAVTACKEAQDALAGEVLENRKAEAVALCDKHGITDPKKRETLETQFLANRAVALAIFDALPAPAAPAAPPKHPPVPLTTKYPASNAGIQNRAPAAAADGEHPFIAKAKELANSQKITLAVAIKNSATSDPKLYGEYIKNIREGTED